MTPEHGVTPGRGAAKPRPRRVIRIPVRPGTSRAMAVGLIAYGVLGLGLIAVALLFVGGGLTTAGGAETRDDLRETLDASRTALRDASFAIRGMDVGLTGAAVSAGSAGVMMSDMSGSLRALAASLRITILGTQPFAGPAADFDRLADRAAAVADDLETVRASVSVSAADTVRLADSIDRLELQMADLQASLDVATGDGLGTARLLLAVLLGWLAVPAFVSLWLGVHWARPSRPGTGA